MYFYGSACTVVPFSGREFFSSYWLANNLMAARKINNTKHTRPKLKDLKTYHVRVLPNLYKIRFITNILNNANKNEVKNKIL